MCYVRTSHYENNKQKLTRFKSFLQSVTSAPLFSPCVALMSLSSPLLSTLYPSQSQLWCMHEGGFPEDQRGHYPGAIRPLVEHVDECWVLLCFLMQPLVNVGEVVGDSHAAIKCSLIRRYFSHNCLYFYWVALFLCLVATFDVVVVFVAREEVGPLIGAVSCRQRERGVSHHHQDETLWHLSMKVPESLAVQHCWVCILLYFTVGKGGK